MFKVAIIGGEGIGDYKFFVEKCAFFLKNKTKNGIMILYFVEDQHSSYYKSDKFKHILQYVTAHQQRYTFKQFKNRLQISVRSVADTEAGLAALKSITIV